MNKAARFLLEMMLLGLMLPGLQASNRLILERQVTGPIETNCYLLYDEKSKEAALFDVGGPIERLTGLIDAKGLTLKYIFATHVHMDHVEGVLALRAKYPRSKLCYNRLDWEDFPLTRDWMHKNFPPEVIAELRQNPATAKWEEYDFSIFGPPDIFLEDNQAFRLGEVEIKTILSPGHSRGAMCFKADDILLSGDVLFYRSVGRTDLLGGSRPDQIRSVQKLYQSLPDATKVYPGHGEYTDIGSEKKENKRIRLDSVSDW